MNALDIPTNVSPFDAIRRIESDGSERWYGRDLMTVMDYSRWERFAAVINKAKASLGLVQGDDAAEHHFPMWGSDGGRWGAGKVADFRLTRFGAYLTAMAGDDTKPAVAQARVYFAVRARQAEVVEQQAPRPVIPQTYADALRLAADQAERNAELESRLAIAAPKAALVDEWVDPHSDTATVLSVAGHFGVTEPKFREYLVERGVLYRRLIVDYIGRDGRRRTEYEWHAKGQYKPWFTTRKQEKAPRLHNGQYRTTLYFNPIGLEGVARLVAKHPITGTAS